MLKKRQLLTVNLTWVFFNITNKTPQKTWKKLLKTCLKKVNKSFQQFQQALQKQQKIILIFDFSQKVFIMTPVPKD